MTSINPFLNWLNGVECKKGPINSYYYALFSEKFRGIVTQMNESSSLRSCFENNPDFDILKELEYEKKVNGVSRVLRELLIKLLKLARPDKEIKNENFMEEIRGFVASLYSVKTNQKPLLPNKPFHQFPDELKLWLICALVQYNSEDVTSPSWQSRSSNGPLNHPWPIGRDSTGNLYFTVNDNLLYVQYGTKLQEMTRIDEEKNLSTMEKRIIWMPRWKLLADSKAHWTRIAMLLDSFEEIEIARRIEEVMEESTSRSVVNPPSIDSEEDHRHSPSQSSLHEEQIEKEDTDSDQFQRVLSRRSRTQLRKPPSIDSEGELRHSPSHDKSQESDRVTDNSSPVNSREDNPLNGQKAKTVRCMYYPHCKRSDDQCLFVHPNTMCKNFTTDMCPGMYCRFIHPTCDKDGSCNNNQCPFEHKLTMPSIRRTVYAKMKESGESTRKGSNRSTGSQQYKRTKNEYEENLNNYRRETHRDAEPSPPTRVTNPERTPVSPVHNERPFSNKELRCHYFPRCSKPADRCTYAHPRDHCASYPNCVRGRDCPFLHGPCSNDGKCVQEYCQSEHYRQIPPRASIAYQRRLQTKRE